MELETVFKPTPTEKAKGIAILKKALLLRNRMKELSFSEAKKRAILEKHFGKLTPEIWWPVWSVLHGGIAVWSGRRACLMHGGPGQWTYRRPEDCLEDVIRYIVLDRRGVQPIPVERVPLTLPTSLDWRVLARPHYTNPDGTYNTDKYVQRMPHHRECRCTRCCGKTPHPPGCFCHGSYCARKGPG